jgi:hypothetical protein
VPSLGPSTCACHDRHRASAATAECLATDPTELFIQPFGDFRFGHGEFWVLVELLGVLHHGGVSFVAQCQGCWQGNELSY